MSKFTTKNDIWGIRKTVKKLWDKEVRFSSMWSVHWRDRKEYQDLAFDAFYNQFVPEVWRETKETVLRHLQEIKGLIYSPGYQVGYIWYERNKQFTCAMLSESLFKLIEAKQVNLPTYLEVEEEKMVWQSHPQYKYEEKSQPLKEELITIRIKK